MIADFFEWAPYELEKKQKNKKLTEELIRLTRYHQAHCEHYRHFLAASGYVEEKVQSVADIPFFPVRLFKEMDLLSIDQSEVFKIMTSSGTTGQKASKIFLDKETAMLQQKAMIQILGDFWGKQRLPMLVVDSPDIVRDRAKFSARGAALMGFRMMTREMTYVLNSDMSLNWPALHSFLGKYQHQKFIVFGFTFMVWQHFYKALLGQEQQFDFANAYLMTGGGWKKLEAGAVPRQEFKERLRAALNFQHFLDHYGMVEQTGCMNVECAHGHLHASNFSDVIVRNPVDFSVCDIGQKGILQLVSVLPHSYPGHSLLSEDEGMILGEDDCPCGRKGKYLAVLGRLKNAELRGCSDVYASRF